ncbi:N-(5'phosphoribosyl)anthranilate isomerase [Marvinbryantia formatexigens DSM 14469]|uniref:N-(5'-phosphoribosyl)anthranilate isomerase n=1 Tax=Marvinbryantia formatexigens DSM 14469 TaxID=478749 RepID=C6LHS8_9FIRM|nr:phosphoribosylanthranilate isomerase [Marvinbryantia formatexigens]EET59818.1 N-(5'phosphoribosyl)anthranilate isomerase [Marvinbryantia formatexigens DSM 14469]UWO23316.1 phosphoribosylanthranilate isomerase [Marvinbryantia formatexigens DSM 14469]SDG41830.1 phosphoribosylanthranilate isomerase [Marvinbryantia formatexigens]
MCDKNTGAAVRLKICGLSRPCDIDYVNEAHPDFAGFVVNYPKSRRSVTPQQLAQLRAHLDEGVLPVGVFVNEAPELVAKLLNDGIISLAQLHGDEDENYLKRLRTLTDGRLIQAFTIRSEKDAKLAMQSTADYILLDNGKGTGERFDWRFIREISRPWILAGGLTPENIRQAAESLRPWALDLSSGVETDGYKDRAKILAAAAAIRNMAGII